MTNSRERSLGPDAPAPAGHLGALPWLAASALLALVALLPLAGCGGASPATAAHAATSTPTLAPHPATATPAGLISYCPDPTLPAIGSGATLTLRPNSGPAGTQMTVDITGLQPGCHLWLGQTMQPCTCETGGYVPPAPREVGGYLRWVEVPSTGEVHTTFCVCHPTYAYVPGYPPYPNAIPSPGDGGNIEGYGAGPGDHFYISVAGATIPDPPPLFALYTVTQ